ncbi:SH3-like domain-containing protein [Listeria grayi]|nr:SH3-like domain-containing protein [Listeria grayi]
MPTKSHRDPRSKTSRSTWVQIKYGNKLLGWINKKAIK